MNPNNLHKIIRMKKYTIILLFLSLCFSGFSQDSISYRAETFGSVSTGETTPFHMVNNTYGTVPLNANNVYLRGAVGGKHVFNRNLDIKGGIDLIETANHSSSFFIQQLYGELRFKSLMLTLGQKEYSNSMLNRELSSGDFNYSGNARPIPEIRIGIPSFVPVPLSKNRLHIRGDFTLGKSTDSKYIERTAAPKEDYSKDISWHRKSLFLLWKDTKGKSPFSAMIGLEHAVQFGGWTSIKNTGKMHVSFSDFMRMVFGKDGSENSSQADQMNVVGNQQGTINAKFGYEHKDFMLSIYKQHYFDDGSGMEFANWRDGIWGIECLFFNQSYVKNILFEFISTFNQSGPIHFVGHQHPEGLDVRGGGNDDYYNHSHYVTGWSYWGRSLGSPLITSPEYNEDGSVYFKNNRIKALHLGLSGQLNRLLDYRMLITGMHAWGRMTYPFLRKKKDFSFLAECTYTLPRAKGWKVGLQFSTDRGTLYDNTLGGGIKISKTGSILNF